MKVAIIGSGAAGISTASNIRRYDENMEITVLTLEKQVAYSPCAIPYVLSGEVERFEDIVLHEPEDYLNGYKNYNQCRSPESNKQGK